MKNALIAAAAAAAVFAVAAPASAQETETYGNLGYSNIDFDGLEVDAVHARVGGRMGHFGGEIEGAIGVNDDVVELDWAVAAYANAWFDIGDNVSLTARVGFGRTGYSAFGVDDSDSSINYGVGAQFVLDGANGIRADYTRWDFSELEEADVWSVSYVRKF